MMPTINVTYLQEVRRRTGAGLLQCKTALETNRGDIEQAVEALRKQGIVKAETRLGRQTSEGSIASYVHHNGKLAALVEINCETDFVARTNDFAMLARHIAEQVAAAAPLVVERAELPADVVEDKRREFEDETRTAGKPDHLVEKIVGGKMEAYFRRVVLTDQAWVREEKVTIGELVKQVAARTGEAIRIRRFSRFHMGSE